MEILKKKKIVSEEVVNTIVETTPSFTEEEATAVRLGLKTVEEILAERK